MLVFRGSSRANSQSRFHEDVILPRCCMHKSLRPLNILYICHSFARFQCLFQCKFSWRWITFIYSPSPRALWSFIPLEGVLESSLPGLSRLSCQEKGILLASGCVRLSASETVLFPFSKASCLFPETKTKTHNLKDYFNLQNCPSVLVNNSNNLFDFLSLGLSDRVPRGKAQIP